MRDSKNYRHRERERVLYVSVVILSLYNGFYYHNSSNMCSEVKRLRRLKQYFRDYSCFHSSFDENLFAFQLWNTNANLLK